jgi:RimJ/RimL family protein N-acetyltransferase
VPVVSGQREGSLVKPRANNHICIRRASAVNAEAFLELFEAVTSATDFLGFEPAERSTTVKAQAEIFERQNVSKDIHLIMLADGKSVGFVSILRQIRRKSCHIGTLVIGIHPQYQGRRLGSQLCEAVINLARKEGLIKLELTVVIANASAVRLYLSKGFRVEGLRRASMNCGGRFLDEYHMGLLL